MAQYMIETVTITLAKYMELQAKAQASEGKITAWTWDSHYFYFPSQDDLQHKMLDQIKKLEEYNRLLSGQLRDSEKGKR